MIPDRAFHLCLRNIEGDTFADPFFDAVEKLPANIAFNDMAATAVYGGAAYDAAKARFDAAVGGVS